MIAIQEPDVHLQHGPAALTIMIAHGDQISRMGEAFVGAQKTR